MSEMKERRKEDRKEEKKEIWCYRVWRVCVATRISYITNGTTKWYSYFEEHFSGFSKQLSIYFLCDLGVSLLSIYPRNMKLYVHTKICSQCSEKPLCKNNQKLETIQMCLSKRMNLTQCGIAMKWNVTRQ